MNHLRRPPRGAIWTAVSTEDKGQTVEGQLLELKDLAARMGIVVLPEHVFTCEESRWHNTPEPKRKLLELIHRRKIDVVLAWSIDRWSRTRKEGFHEIFETLPSCGVTFVSLQEPWINTHSIPEWVREMLGHIFLSLAEEESRRLSERIKLRYKANRNRAAGGGGKARWGRGRIPTPAEEEKIWAMRAQGLSIRAIARQVSIPRSTVGWILKKERNEGRPNGDLGKGGGL